jgi:radical SAM protein with 4Fe4S-binding SPASM domain
VNVPQLPRRLQLEVTGSCNLACRMCLVRYRPKLSRRAGALDLDLFRRLLDELPDLEEITLQGLGEPLLAPGLWEMIELATSRGIRVGFNTNATLLSRPAAERLVASGARWVHVSLDGPSAETYESIRDGADFERVRRNLAGLLQARRAAGSATPRVLIVLVAMRRNVETVPELVDLAAGLGADGVFVQNLSHDFQDAGDTSYDEIRAFVEDEQLWEGDPAAQAAFAEARRRAGRAGLELRLPGRGHPAPRAADEPGCSWPFDAAYITHEGRVQPCCMVMGSERATLGELTGRSFSDVWQDAPYQAFREALQSDDPPACCSGCALYRRVF